MDKIFKIKYINIGGIIINKRIIVIIILALLLGIGAYYFNTSIHQTPTSPDMETINLLIKTLKKPSLVKSMIISDDTFPGILWTPKSNENQVNISSKLVTYLEQATIYTKKIPKSQDVRQNAGNIGPSQLHILSTDNGLITICPVYYVTTKNDSFSVKYISDVVDITKDNKHVYIKNNKLYNWLKNNEWKTDYKHM